MNACFLKSGGSQPSPGIQTVAAENDCSLCYSAICHLEDPPFCNRARRGLESRAISHPTLEFIDPLANQWGNEGHKIKLEGVALTAGTTSGTYMKNMTRV